MFPSNLLVTWATCWTLLKSQHGRRWKLHIPRLVAPRTRGSTSWRRKESPYPKADVGTFYGRPGSADSNPRKSKEEMKLLARKRFWQLSTGINPARSWTVQKEKEHLVALPGSPSELLRCDEGYIKVGWSGSRSVGGTTRPCVEIWEP